MANTVEKQEYIEEELRACYDEDSTKISFIAPMYWSIGENGEKIWNILEIVCVDHKTNMRTWMCGDYYYLLFNNYILCNKPIFIVEEKSSSYECKDNGIESPVFQNSNISGKRMPFFEVYVSKLASLAAASVAIYPSLEPLIAMFCIKDFKRYVTCSRTKVLPGSTYQLSTGA
nr:hypothetical protein C12D5.1 - Caenorhabditis elegans [Caenorhabditis elegans]